MGYKSVLSIALVAGLLSTTAHFALAKNSDTVIEKLDSVLFVDPTKDFGGSGTHKDPASMEEAKALLETDEYTEAYIIDGTQEERDDLSQYFSKKSGGQVLDNSRAVKVIGAGAILKPGISPEAVAHVLKSAKTHKPHGQKRRDQSTKVAEKARKIDYDGLVQRNVARALWNQQNYRLTQPAAQHHRGIARLPSTKQQFDQASNYFARFLSEGGAGNPQEGALSKAHRFINDQYGQQKDQVHPSLAALKQDHGNNNGTNAHWDNKLYQANLLGRNLIWATEKVNKTGTEAEKQKVKNLRQKHIQTLEDLKTADPQFAGDYQDMQDELNAVH
ncbi:MAG: hypothetical protein HOL16_00460 [Alphaproteobacteria bacterium]|nr:hypothetical protein [Alphaproteobacteria bacterium]